MSGGGEWRWREWRILILGSGYGMAFEALWLGRWERALWLAGFYAATWLVCELVRWLRRHVRWVRDGGDQ